MPCYVYFCASCGASAEEVRPMAQAAFRPRCTCGTRMDRDIAAEQNIRAHVSCQNWPLHSDAMAVDPSQITEAVEDARKRGVPTDFDRDGRAVFTGPGHRKRYCEAYGTFTKNAGYSDPAPR